MLPMAYSFVILRYSQNMCLPDAISHNREEETLEAKALWFSSLTMEERMQIFCDLTDIALSIDPSLPGKKHVEPTSGSVQIITTT